MACVVGDHQVGLRRHDHVDTEVVDHRVGVLAQLRTGGVTRDLRLQRFDPGQLRPGEVGQQSRLVRRGQVRSRRYPRPTKVLSCVTRLARFVSTVCWAWEKAFGVHSGDEVPSATSADRDCRRRRCPPQRRTRERAWPTPARRPRPRAPARRPGARAASALEGGVTERSGSSGVSLRVVHVGVRLVEAVVQRAELGIDLVQGLRARPAEPTRCVRRSPGPMRVRRPPRAWSRPSPVEFDDAGVWRTTWDAPPAPQAARAQTRRRGPSPRHCAFESRAAHALLRSLLRGGPCGLPTRRLSAGPVCWP